MTTRSVFSVVFCLVLTILSVGCAPRVIGPGPVFPPREPELIRTALITPDGVSLSVDRWEADNPRAVIIALHGMNDYANAFSMPGPWWAEQTGITTYAYDQRGFGRSEFAGMWPGEERLYDDLESMIRVVKERHPGLPVFVLGDSMGGAVAIATLAKRRPPVDGLILVAPAVWGWSSQPFHHRAALWTVAHTFPGMSFTGEGLEIWPSDNIEMLRGVARDPLVIKGTRADAIYGLVGLMDEAYVSASEIGVPVLLLYGEKDEIIPPEPVEHVARSLCGRVPLKIAIYKNGYHMLLRDLQGEVVWRDVAGWTLDPGANLNSQTKDEPLSRPGLEYCPTHPSDD